MAGFRRPAPLIDANVRKLGFKTEDIKLIAVSHGHFDHGGGVHVAAAVYRRHVAASTSTARRCSRGENTPDDPQFAFGTRVQRVSGGQDGARGRATAR